jgi:hypothetical protein
MTKKSTIQLNRQNILPCNPEVSSYIVARDPDGNPSVFVVRGWNEGKPAWIIRHRLSHPISYMFKDTGEFGYTEDQADAYKHSFQSSDKAIKHFFSFYGPAR